MDNEIWFYEPEDRDGYLSNFACYPIYIDGTKWQTSEHYYQAKKFKTQKIITEIQQAPTPDEAFNLSRKYQDNIRDDWEIIKRATMSEVVNEKFQQHPQLAHKLIATGTCVIKEHSHKDAYWGDGGDGKGDNHLGKILMEIRTLLKKQAPYHLLHYVETAKLPTPWGTFAMHGFVEPDTGKEHLALSYGHWQKDEAVLMRIHSECLTGDALFSMRCDCGFQLQKAMQKIVKHGSGVLLYLRQEGRGIGLLNKIRAYQLQDHGADTVEANERLGFAADLRQYNFCESMLSFLGINEVRLMTNNPRKVKALKKIGINIVERVKLQEGHNRHNHFYLSTKAEKLGHMFEVPDKIPSTAQVIMKKSKQI